MRLKSARFKNLIGIYRGSGLKDIYIDFTKCISNMIMIVGPNGSGKSTLMEVLSPLPESSSMYLPNQEGLKEIEYIDNNDIYRIRIIYPITISGSRSTTKAYLTKISIDGEIECNPNGNISSFKDELYSRFNLDPNFVSLSKLSMEDKGLVEKTPSERKKYVSNILDSVEVYNNIYKALSKRSSIFKSMINSITSKIDTIGDEESLLGQYQSISKSIELLNKEKEKQQRLLSDCESTIRILDPGNRIKDLYTELRTNFINVQNDIKTISLMLPKDINDIDSYIKTLNNINSNISKYEYEIEYNRKHISELLVSREEESRAIQLKQSRLESLSSDFNYDELKKEVDLLRNNIKKYISTFNEIGISNFNNVSKDEYIIGLNTLKELKDMVDSMRSSYSDFDISEAIEYISNSSMSIINYIHILEGIRDDLTLENNSLSTKIEYYKGLLKSTEILCMRPDKCNIDDCSFIKDALDAKKSDPERIINECSATIDINNDKLLKITKDIEDKNTILQIINIINIIIRNINTNSSILKKMPNGNIFSDIDNFLNKLDRGSSFNEINNLYEYIRYANYFELYKDENNRLIQLESQLKIYESKNEIIDELNSDIEDISVKLNTVINDIEDTNNDIKDKTISLEDLYRESKRIDDIINTLNRLNQLRISENDIKSKIDTVLSNVQAIETSTNEINKIQSVLNNINIDIDPMMNSKDEIKYSLQKLREYKEELNIYNAKYEKTEMVKKYASPKGIQTVFMQMYMGKTLLMANSLLSLLFDSKLTLLEYIINENEFRIPCKSSTSDIINDDIKSCSSGEKSMIGMVINYSLLKQSSTKYNILKLDELDDPLDQNNRSQFPILLQQIMKLLDVENCIMISHSSEIDMSNIDIIYLSYDNNYPDGNIIFKYENN